MTVSLYEELARKTMPDPARTRTRRLRVLILEDDETDRLRVIRVLRRAGFDAEIAEAEDIDSFEAKLRAAPYDLVFIDYYLGFETGLDALQLLTAHPNQERAVPVMLSRATEPQVIVQAMHAGCADYVLKDALDVDALRHCIGAAVERRILLGAMREGQDLRLAIRRLVERLTTGRLSGFAEPEPEYKPKRISEAASNRLSKGLLADLEMLWHLRRDQDPS